jgi:hypothetical protein
LLLRPAAFLALVVSCPAASETHAMERSQLVDAWSAVIYCRNIYEEPDIRGRIYPGDRNSCEAAHANLGRMALSGRPPEEAQAIAAEAGQKARVIRYNTRSAQDAVPACRQQCREFEKEPDKVDENPENTARMR